MLFANVFKRKEDVENDLKDDLLILQSESRLLKARLSKLEAEVLDVATAQDIIRNKVLRKIQFKKEVESEENKEGWNGIPLIN